MTEYVNFPYKLDCDKCKATARTEKQAGRSFWSYRSTKTAKMHGRCEKHLASKP